MKSSLLDLLLILLLAFAAAHSTSVDAAQLLHMDAKNRIPGAYKVIFKDQASLERMTARGSIACSN